mmetsp:Transcript_88484/g.153588  ORF Transcript_88484/g.153588 Transcript_88484/m.153588 type:complete len:221 (+) Transcript_88484:232-894(+)
MRRVQQEYWSRRMGRLHVLERRSRPCTLQFRWAVRMRQWSNPASNGSRIWRLRPDALWMRCRIFSSSASKQVTSPWKTFALTSHWLILKSSRPVWRRALLSRLRSCQNLTPVDGRPLSFLAQCLHCSLSWPGCRVSWPCYSRIFNGQKWQAQLLGRKPRICERRSSGFSPTSTTSVKPAGTLQLLSRRRSPGTDRPVKTMTLWSRDSRSVCQMLPIPLLT